MDVILAVHLIGINSSILDAYIKNNYYDIFHLYIINLKIRNIANNNQTRQIKRSSKLI